MSVQELIVADTGFLLSVASTRLILPSLEQRWAGRMAWPHEVLSELQHIDLQQRDDIPPGLASSAIKCGQRLFGDPIALDDDQRDRASGLAARIGGFNPGGHDGEAAGAILAQDSDGILVLEDSAAAPVISSEGVRTIDLRTVLYVVSRDINSTLGDAELAIIIGDLNSKNRPNFHEMTPADIRNRSWQAG